MGYLFEADNLIVTAGENKIISNFCLKIKAGEVHVIMGPNGSGKSTLSNAIMGHPKYKITGGKIILGNEDITNANPWEKARKGLFLSMQHIPEIPGVTVANFLRTAFNSLTGKSENPVRFYKQIKEKMIELGIEAVFADRYLNVGFSGGEKKKLEILQLILLNPRLAILDEIDSGLDVDALRELSDGINKFLNDRNGILLITHYSRILKFIKPDYIHIMDRGRIVTSGGADLSDQIEKIGYRDFKTSATK